MTRNKAIARLENLGMSRADATREIDENAVPGKSIWTLFANSRKEARDAIVEYYSRWQQQE